MMEAKNFCQPSRRRQRKKHNAVAELINIYANDNRMKILLFEIGVTPWRTFIQDFVNEIEIDRVDGFLQLDVKLHEDKVSWFFRKLDIYVIGVRDGKLKLFQLGAMDDGEIRWLDDAPLTDYGNKYRDFLDGGKIIGQVLSANKFEFAQIAVIENAGKPLLWKQSFAIIALMISESARFVSYRDVLTENFSNGSEMVLAAEGDGPCDWAAFMPNHWLDFSKCASRFVDPEPVLYDPQTMMGAYECLVNPTAAYKALLLKCLY